MDYKDELITGECNNNPQQAVRAGKATPAKSKKLKKTEGDESSQAGVVAVKAALDGAHKTRNKA